MQKPGSDIVSVVGKVGGFGKVLSRFRKAWRFLKAAICFLSGYKEDDLVKGKMIIEIKATPVHKEVEIDIKEGEQETKGPS